MSESLVWMDVPCPLCGARRDEPILMAPTEHGTCRLARCGACSMVYLNPRPSDETLGHLYPDEYGPYDIGSQQTEPGPWQRVQGYLRKLALARYEGYPPGTRAGAQRALAPLGRWLLDRQGETMTRLPWVGEGRLLDYGCGSGWYAARMKALGWNVTAMDFNPSALVRVVERYRLPVIAGTLPHAKVKPASFDAITMGCVLEHLSDPHRVIDAAARALAPGGVLAIMVPNIASWGFRTFGPDWFGLSLPLHLLHFSPATLRQLVERHGLEVREVVQVGRPGWLRRSSRQAGERSGANLTRRLLCKAAGWGPVSRLLGRWGSETRQADAIKLIAARPAAAAKMFRLAA